MIVGQSIYKRILLGLAGVGIVSGLVLLGAVFLDYHLEFGDFMSVDAASAAWHEVFEHVVLPALLFVFPIGLAVIVVVRRALAPLENAAQEIEAARGKERGFRLEVGDFPDEGKPFAVALNDLLARIERSAQQQELSLPMSRTNCAHRWRWRSSNSPKSAARRGTGWKAICKPCSG